MDQVQQLRNLKDFLLVYNRMTEICFQRCTTNFNYRALTMDEERCVDSCAGKLIRSNHRLMGTYVQLMPKMMQRRMDELESKAAEVAKAEAEAQAQAGSAGVEQAAGPAVPIVPTVPDPGATEVPVGIISPDMAAPITTLDTPPPPVFVPEATGAVPDLSSAASPAADMQPVMNGPSVISNGAGNGALLFAPPPPLPEVSGALPALTESPSVSSEAKAAVPLVVEGPSTPLSILPSVTEIPTLASVLSTSGEKSIPSPVELPSTAPPALPVTAPSTESNSLVPDLTKATLDATAPVVVPVLKPADLTSGVSITSTSSSSSDSTAAGSQSSS